MSIRRGWVSSGRTFEDVAKAFSVAANVDPIRRRSLSPSSFFAGMFQNSGGGGSGQALCRIGAPHGFPMTPSWFGSPKYAVVEPGKNDVDTGPQGTQATQVRVLLP
jgi:hypothetical protein